MAAPDVFALASRLQADFGVARVLPAPRAALGLMAVLQAWTAAGHTPRVAVCANICHEVVAAILGAGCQPVFVDIDVDTATVPADDWRRARASGASAAVAAHLYGNPVDMAVVRRFFPAPECLLVDDAAQALGAVNAAGKVGAQGDVGLLSFGSTKQIETGGAAILCADAAFAEAVAARLARMDEIPDSQRADIQARFRVRLVAARAALRSDGDAASGAFAGMLSGYAPSLRIAYPEGAAAATLRGLDDIDAIKASRITKSAAWREALQDSPLVPLNLQPGAVPWRFVCRLPDAGWIGQHRLGEAMRGVGLDVSHWYLPAHWMCGYAAGTLPGVERLSREIFQFWIDDSIDIETVRRQGAQAYRMACEAAV